MIIFIIKVIKETSEGIESYLSDHLGSTSLMVGENVLEVECTDYFPYGQFRSGGLEKYSFTGQENDDDTGIIYYGAGCTTVADVLRCKVFSPWVQDFCPALHHIPI
ncbi:hypothetical protein FXV91_13990 [Methanosarcina sp. DH2]|uniref:hypothetical protein n=1 Tax=Methanosarcina sp. DH2 TaxID=2605639 RepID=UPI001E3B7F66|nr:hypothetical protein [Methanosarcina sp. DH2]MCC4771233.1 hypothetical protein [Methanosarcina sp. DH2]